MPFAFSNPAPYAYQPGGFFLGLDDQNREIGIRSERHLITIAGARSGKGAALIIPNLKRWSGSCVVVDPKGENATETAGNRSDMGQFVGVVDPYEIAKGAAIPLRCSINPLALLDLQSLSIRADLEALGDGLIRRFDTKHAQWDNAAASICAGITDFVINTEPPEARNLLSVRRLLLQPDDTLKAVALAMTEANTRAGLARQAGVLILNKFSNPESVPASAFNRAIEETGWIDDPAFASILGGDALRSFDLATLKAGNGSLYLCIPPRLLNVRGSFLRVFVSMGLHVMASDLAERDDEHEKAKTGRCLFLLDEFHSLGKLDLVAKAAGLLPGYGVHLWPFLQDMGQLEALYGSNEMGTFFGNADAHIFFGNADASTLDYVSGRLGDLTMEEIGKAPVHVASRPSGGQGAAMLLGAGSKNRHVQSGAQIGGMMAAGLLNGLNAMSDRAAAHETAEWQAKASKVGKPRVAPDEVREFTARKDGDDVARSMIVFAKGRDVLLLRLAPHFRPPTAQSAGRPKEPPHKAAFWRLAGRVALVIGFLFIPSLLIEGVHSSFGPALSENRLIFTALLIGGYGAAAWALFKTDAGKKLRLLVGWGQAQRG